MKENLNQNSRSLKWEPNGELAQKDLSELIERLKNVEGDDTSSEFISPETIATLQIP